MSLFVVVVAVVVVVVVVFNRRLFLFSGVRGEDLYYETKIKSWM